MHLLIGQCPASPTKLIFQSILRYCNRIRQMLSELSYFMAAAAAWLSAVPQIYNRLDLAGNNSRIEDDSWDSLMRLTATPAVMLALFSL
ncbi:MAG TPA: hypothetical protein VGM05_20675 [Planctomycetaceae bacterium]